MLSNLVHKDTRFFLEWKKSGEPMKYILIKKKGINDVLLKDKGTFNTIPLPRDEIKAHLFTSAFS